MTEPTTDRVTVRTTATYSEAQRAVDYLADRKFAVENLQIIGTGLKTVETVTGRLTWGRAALSGIAAGVWIGLFVGFLFAIFSVGTGRVLGTILLSMLWGALFGLIFGLISYALSGGRRDFSSVGQMTATQYEITCTRALAEEARTVLASMPVR